ncbi:MAG TPA: PAS domain S-box protein [Gammaproteobacteria bacterium]|nr:PAS domain S-box protein [Gammaproteobacteria bacterium]
MVHATKKILSEYSSPLLQYRSSDSGKGLVLPGKKSPIDYQLLIDAVSQHAAVCVTDREGRLFYVNEKLCAISGYCAEELLGQNYRLFLSNEYSEAFHEQLWQTLADGQIWRGELKQITRHEMDFWVDATATPFAEGAGGPGLYVFVQTDITSFKQTEAALQTSEEKHRALLEQANDAIVLVDMDGWLVAANRRAEKLTGYVREELVNMHMQQLVPECVRSELLDLHQDVLEKKCDSFHGGVVLRKDGGVLPVDLSCAVVESGGQRVIQSILRDITSRKMMETELIRARIAAERANRAKTEFMSRISHELRTPLNAILGFGQLMQTDETEPLADSHREGINQILNAGWHLLELIEDVLNFSQIETGSLRVELCAVSARDVLQECRDLLEPLAAERNITLELMPVAEHIMLLADRVRLKEILLNLGSNAIKYNKINGCVSFSALVESGKVRINVSDTGIGIRPEKMRQLFEPFERLGQEDSAIQGSGLGLVIAKRLTELMGGNLGVWSEAGVGSTFWVDLKLME